MNIRYVNAVVLYKFCLKRPYMRYYYYYSKIIVADLNWLIRSSIYLIISFMKGISCRKYFLIICIIPLSINNFITPSSLFETKFPNIINTGAIIEHDCSIGDFSHIAPGAVLAGNVSIGSGCMIGANSVIKQGVKVGDNVIIGAGAVVLKDVNAETTFVGNPAKQI